MQTNKLTDQQYWSSNFGKIRLYKYKNSNYHKYLSRFLNADPQKTCIEIGAYPGSNLGYLAKVYQYNPTALDFLDEVDFVKANMEFNGINNCEIIKKDFLKWEAKNKYDVVCSHGFVEHFTNYEDVIEKHISILKDNGILIISVPNLEYYQLWIRKILYTSEKFNTIMDIHNRKIMKLKMLKHLILNKHGLKILYGRHINGMKIWFPPNEQTIRMNRIFIFKLAKQIEKIIDKLRISNKFISPEILIIAQKVVNEEK